MSETPNLVAEIFGDAKGQDKRAKILNQVRGLLAQADDPSTTPQEADAFRNKANQFMAMYAIEQWHIDALDKGAHRPTAEIRYFDFNWFYDSSFRDDLWYIFHTVARHCRCIVALRGHGVGEHSFREIPVIGIASDLDWFDLLFTSVMLQMANKLEPVPDPSLTFGENCFILRMSGMNRLRVAQLLWEAHQLPEDVADTSQPFDNVYSAKTKKALRAIRKAGEEYAKARGLETTKISTVVWQRSFALGFRREINRRVRLMADLKEEKPGTGESNALVLRDIYQMALDLYREMWPKPEPVKVEHGSDQRRRRVAMVREKKYSERAVDAGREAGARANLSGHPSEGIGRPHGELPK